jgi:hypothetical protein
MMQVGDRVWILYSDGPNKKGTIKATQPNPDVPRRQLYGVLEDIHKGEDSSYWVWRAEDDLVSLDENSSIS